MSLRFDVQFKQLTLDRLQLPVCCMHCDIWGMCHVWKERNPPHPPSTDPNYYAVMLVQTNTLFNVLSPKLDQKKINIIIIVTYYT